MSNIILPCTIYEAINAAVLSLHCICPCDKSRLICKQNRYRVYSSSN